MVALRVLTGSYKVGGCTSFITSPFFQHTPSKERDVCNEKREWIVKKERVSHPPPRSPHAGDTRIHRISIEKIAGKFGATISDNSAKARGKGLNATLHAKFPVLPLAESVFRSARAGVTAVTCSLQNNKTSHTPKKTILRASSCLQSRATLKLILQLLPASAMSSSKSPS